MKLLELIRDFVRLNKFYASKITKCNMEELAIKVSDTDIRKVFSYPSASRTLRGVGGQVLYLEEAAFLDLNVFFEIVVPLLEMQSEFEQR